jgi:ferredoxin
MEGKSMNAQIFYFSGTGNSLHVARELQRKLPGASVVPMIRALHFNKIEPAAEIVGLVFPIYCFSMPFPVKQLLEKINLKSSSYIFSIVTRGGSPCKVFSYVNKLLRKQGKSLDAYFYIEMPTNYIPFFKLDSQEIILQMELNLQRRLNSIRKIVLNKETSHEKDHNQHGFISLFLKYIVFPILTFCAEKTRYSHMEKSFYADGKCIGCGLCEKVCLSEKIKMNNAKPQWREKVNCHFCFACLHYCTVQAVQIRKTKTAIRGRYHHAQINADDIARQKV